MEKSLTVLITTFNDEDFLLSCIESVRHIAQEIIIADQGSTDDTVTIAHSYGAETIVNRDRDDFSETLNSALTQISTEWVLWLKGNEQLLIDPTNRVEELFHVDDIEAYHILIKDLNDASPENMYTYQDVRMFRATSAFRFTGVYGDQISLSNSHRLKDAPLTIGRNNSQTNRKSLIQHIRLLKRRMENQPDNPEYTYRLGTIYAQLGRTNIARTKLIQSLLNTPDQAPYRPMLIRDLAKTLLTLQEEQEADLLLSAATQEYPDYTDLHYLLGICREHLGLLDEAYMSYQKAIESSPDLKSYVVCTGMSTHLALTGMAGVLVKQQRSVEAVKLYSRALQFQPLYRPALDGATAAHFDLNTSGEDLETYLTNFVPLTTSDNRFFLAQVLYHYGAYKQAVEVLTMAVPDAIDPSLLLSDCYIHCEEFERAFIRLQSLLTLTSNPSLLRRISLNIGISCWAQRKSIPKEIYVSAKNVDWDPLIRIENWLLNSSSTRTELTPGDPLLEIGRILIERCAELGLIALGSQLLSLSPSLENEWVHNCYKQGFVSIAANCLVKRMKAYKITAEELCIVAENLSDQGRYQEATAIFERSLQMTPEKNRAHIGIVHSYLNWARQLIYDRLVTLNENPDLKEDLKQIEISLRKLRGLCWRPNWSPSQRRNMRVTTSDFIMYDSQE